MTASVNGEGGSDFAGPPPSRDIIVIDVETTGLYRSSAVLEVAAINLSTGEELYFVPYVNDSVFDRDSYKALQINRYFERGVWESMLNPETTRPQYMKLAMWLHGNTFAGCNPTFDAAMLPSHVTVHRHHRLLDLSAYAAGVLGTPPNELEGLHGVCEALGVVNEGAHGALEDARATAECFRRLIVARAKAAFFSDQLPPEVFSAMGGR